MSSSRRIAWMMGIWLFILVIYSTVSLSLKPGSAPLSTFGNLVQCLVPLLANAGLLLNAGTPHWRQNLFWMLIAMSCTLWMIGQFQWTYRNGVLKTRDIPALQRSPTFHQSALLANIQKSDRKPEFIPFASYSCYGTY